PEVSYCGLEELRFAVQVGNSAVRNGRETKDFISQFYHFLKPWTVSYPPTFYPLDYKKGRAPRIVFGEAKDGRPVCLWFEGAGKFNYRPKEDSCGASLSEAAAICMDLGIWNAVHLDGGGSAQIIFEGKRELMVSDRNAEDFSEAERAISMGIYI
ncbi:MAG: phosphodiester glycosidase family protein, partial [Clostridia bacterium]|nr:phosphodiester glycosidase family protein [Clostridia bacterium]